MRAGKEHWGCGGKWLLISKVGRVETFECDGCGKTKIKIRS